MKPILCVMVSVDALSWNGEIVLRMVASDDGTVSLGHLHLV